METEHSKAGSTAPTIFIVDDDPSLLILVARRLSARGHHCLQSRPDSIVFLGDHASGHGCGAVEGHDDQLALVKAVDGMEDLLVVLLIARGAQIARLKAQLPDAILINSRCPSSQVASTVEAEIVRREAA